MNTNSKTRVVPKTHNWGVYVFQLSDGTALSDSDGNVLSLAGVKNDLVAASKMRKAAAYYGVTEGNICFLPGSRKVSQSEWEDQMAAFRDGQEIPGDV